MNCCRHNHDKQSNHESGNKGHLKHMLMMILCCGLPIGLLLLMPFISSVLPGSANLMRFAVPLLCPIIMIAMIPMMIRDRKSQKVGSEKSEVEESNPAKSSNQQPGTGSCH